MKQCSFSVPFKAKAAKQKFVFGHLICHLSSESHIVHLSLQLSQKYDLRSLMDPASPCFIGPYPAREGEQKLFWVMRGNNLFWCSKDLCTAALCFSWSSFQNLLSYIMSRFFLPTNGQRSLKYKVSILKLVYLYCLYIHLVFAECKTLTKNIH